MSIDNEYRSIQLLSQLVTTSLEMRTCMCVCASKDSLQITKRNNTFGLTAYLSLVKETINYLSRGVPMIWEGGGQEYFFPDLEICMSRSDMLRMARPCALLGGFGGMLPRENFFKRCNLVRFRVYFDQILSLFFFKNYYFLYKKN